MSDAGRAGVSLMCPEDAAEAIHVLVSGRVQGVGFRYFVKQAADRSELAGWVRNLRGGHVEAVLIGPGAALKTVLSRIRHGPPDARVDEVVTRDPRPDERQAAVRPLAVRSTVG